MVLLRTVSQDITRDNYRWVPDLGDYSKSWTDEELYQMFGLTKQEQAYIESKIKELK
jgi:site-specific DNA-methyltransferase (adenine-specific)